MQMRILLITGSFPPMKCGVGDYANLLARALAKRSDVDVCVLTDKSSKSESPKLGLEVRASVAGWRLAQFSTVLKTLKDWRPDVVHVQYPTQGYGNGFLPFFLPLICRLDGFRVVQTWHEYYRRMSPGLLIEFLIKAIVPGGLVAVRPSYRETIPALWRWMVLDKQFRFIPNASAIPRAQLSEGERLAVRQGFAAIGKVILVYFGFLHPAKGVELLFRIADPNIHHIVIVGEVTESDAYHSSIMQLAEFYPWRGKVSFTGFLDTVHVAQIMAAADAVVLPFREGAGDWNTSIRGARLQGTFLLTTSRERHGYSELEHTYFARIDDLDDLRNGLKSHVGLRKKSDHSDLDEQWQAIADSHFELYESVIGKA